MLGVGKRSENIPGIFSPGFLVCFMFFKKELRKSPTETTTKALLCWRKWGPIIWMKCVEGDTAHWKIQQQQGDRTPECLKSRAFSSWLRMHVQLQPLLMIPHHQAHTTSSLMILNPLPWTYCCVFVSRWGLKLSFVFSSLYCFLKQKFMW